ncbi:uncharacterized protein LOC114750095 [Neltuma alba]|uniref:uncharacterized protein LOC114750095 n=1 Tax=Neltuma alba TaxID=207710 RepID=UPI0010A2DA09|nr:uncharacterized protein LOC114750095 [Prosopis alba]
MAETTRFKDLQAEVRGMSESMKQNETSLNAKMEQMEANTNNRLDRIEAAIEAFTRAPDARLEKMEAAIVGLGKEADSQHRNIERLNQLVLALESRTEVEHSDGGMYSGGTGGNQHHYHSKQVKVDFPKFGGTDPSHWIFRAEQYFEYYGTPEPHKLVLAAINMEGDVVPWFQLLQKTKVIHNWASLTRAVETEYGPSLLEKPRSKLFKLMHTGLVEDYCREFMALANRTEGISDDALIDCFTSGLKTNVKREVISRRPPTLQKAIELAKIYRCDEEMAGTLKTKASSNPAGSNFRGGNSSFTLGVGPKNALPPLLPTPNVKPMSQVKKMSPAEMMIRREKGLCYTCDAKFTPNHRCPNKQYMLIECEELEKNARHEPHSQTDELKEDLDGEEMTIHHLSLHAYHGSPGKATIRFVGVIGGTEVQILLDGGSSDSFIHPRIAQHLGLAIEKTKNVRVMIGDGNAMRGEGVVRNLAVNIQGYKLEFLAYVLAIAGSDLVIGPSWLATLGPHIANYTIGESYIKFALGDDFITLRRTNQAVVAQAGYHHLQRLVHTKAILECYVLELNTFDSEPDPNIEDKGDINPDLQGIIQDFSSVFDKPHDLPPNREHEHRIILHEGVGPVKVRPYRYPFSQKAEIEKMVQELLNDGFIQPSTSPFSAPVILVKKKDGTWRFCVDYRALNAVTVKDSFPMPIVDELLDELGGSVFYTKLDLRSGYHQVLMHPPDREKTAFRTHQGLYEWLVMPFGLSNAPATFQALMNSVFKPFLRKFVLIFFDDILIYSATWLQHLQHVAEVLEAMARHKLFAKFSKCSFGKTKVEYLGHVISANGVEVDPTKINSVLQWPTPQSVTQLRGFLGLSGYYRRFIRQYANLASPLTKLLHKDAFHWSPEAQTAFDQLKSALTQAPILALPDFSKTFILETDASGVGIGAVLSQNGHPIAYFSKQISPRMQAQSAYVRELYAITQAVAKFRHYLFGHHFIIRTDQESLKHIKGQIIQTPEQEAYLPKLMGYDFSIEYKPGKSNAAADALSRITHMGLVRI